MLPVIERLLNMQTLPDAQHISVLVLSPTRELAQQIAKESLSLIQGRRCLGVHCVVGGTNMRSEAAKFKTQRMDILVAVRSKAEALHKLI